MIEWPELLPCAIRDNYGLQTVSPMIRTEMQSGRARQRRAFTSTPTMANVSWIMTETQSQLFESWWESALVSGSKWFECPLKTPIGLRTYAARFTDVYQGPTLYGACHWRFSATLELRERPIIRGDWAEVAPEYIIMADIFDKAMNREWPAA